MPHPNGSAENPAITRRSFVARIAVAGATLATLRAPAETSLPRKSATPDPAVPRRVVASSASVVEVDSGRLRGFEVDGIFAFKGVPYGASTSGQNRFQRAQKPNPWTGVRNALTLGRACFQARGDSAHFNYDGRNLPGNDEDAFLLHRGAAKLVPGEDCLRLNVWTPEINSPHRRPVMVFMHGGGYESGFDSDLRSYDGENLARNDVVVVTHNHRLNVFGYLNLAELGGERYRDSANVGLLDLVSVLQWVRSNIHVFGGDPGNVTIFGQSGGGGKVLGLMGMSEAKGLFHKAIVQSGPFLGALEGSYSTAVASDVIKELGLSRGSLEKIHDMPVDRLAGAAAEAMRRHTPVTQRGIRDRYDQYGWGPTVDGLVLPRHPFDPRASELSADVPLLTGTNFHEIVSGLDHPEDTKMTEGELATKLQAQLGDRATAVLAAYQEEHPHCTPFDLYGAINAAEFRRCAREQSLRKAALGRAAAYQYVYSWKTPMLEGTPGAFHACELSFAFDNAEVCSHYSGLLPEALALAKQVSGAWVAFARTGNPGHKGIPDWPAFAMESESSMIFDTPCVVYNGFEAKGLEQMAAAT